MEAAGETVRDDPAGDRKRLINMKINRAFLGSAFALLSAGLLMPAHTLASDAATTSTTAAASSNPSTAPVEPLIAFSSFSVPIELPSLSGRLFNNFAYSFHGQTTIIPQFHGDFPADYSGPLSFKDTSEIQTSYTGTLFMGVRVLPGTEVYFNPEVSAGDGLSGVTGIGDPPNGETPRVSSTNPTPVVARLFARQTFGFGGEQEDITDGANTIAGKQDVNRLTITFGQYAANDIFDNNTYAHDPRSQFMNWALSDDTAWDYPANTKGYTQGLTLELNQKNSTLRYGIFRPPANANGGHFDTHFDRAYDQIVEYEQRYALFGQPGVLRPMAYFNESDMGDYRDAIDADPAHPNVTLFRSYSHPKYGFGLNAEQSITPDLAIFGRAGWSNGQSESWAYTEVDRTLSLGLSLKGTPWKRPNDVVGLAEVMSGLSKDHRDYLAAGGLGFELGDGRLNYAPEEVIECYYSLVVTRNLFLTADYQFIDHPGFNADRGPVSIGGVRVHFEF
jgi:high affinity Mn2+ porin